MFPYIVCNTLAEMSDGSFADFEVGKEYKLDCAYKADGETHVTALDDNSMIHTFIIEKEWFTQHFDLFGDLDFVWEEV